VSVFILVSPNVRTLGGALKQINNL
jgi:hypothetical protein